ncbi:MULTISPECIES: phenylacetic acid degradation operon negative regulatory protein PaaX [Acinetobacter calcoaceticus/baumannii complex]|uniref:phenylacetic acid degradation operon negative regulatory protein PaaX n=1 Tax=Acinetobacter calcoaceticus/baumannii complex TaxID=909768 RepID=UPI0021CDCB6A|nr:MULTISPECIES: phenylacetic acid degradation operon negative regulatory protein PaaX [Acinetobacter calcoaceticus/baumannii complex]EIM5576140.1 phenylacetic acid degradation operon negative regulatory protein PaaX [Acinetobacter baumannii]EIO1627742.1 phenylacetic acid degradation operon negative regulatory protein PaaX [Acinetobacter baumannii]EKT9890757.1 phenylacetic acid degradation operon negative regulatory protein PaaX [Acinetobacter baumannii]EKT9963584.1 phenylacetic acid degradatio
MSMSAKIQQIIDSVVKNETLSGTSLISTIFGDSVLHRGGNISLASLIQLLELFGFNDRAVRTSVFRLVKNDWLCSDKIGRTSFYRITDSSRSTYLQAEQRIYNDQMKEWDHYWDLILMSSLDTENKALLKKELEWLGFANISTNLMAYPGCNRLELQRLLVDLNMSEQVVVFKAETLQLFNNSVDTIGRMLRTNWPIDELRQRYLQFLDIFREIGVLLMQENEQLEPVQAFQIRTLLIHYYRRILLKDPALPLELLPTDWPAISARTLSMNIYKKVFEPADEYFLSVAATAEGPMPNATAHYWRRFGGLVATNERLNHALL